MNEEVELRLQQLEALTGAQTVLLSAFIQTHPRYEDWQLSATSLLETWPATIGRKLSVAQQEFVRTYVGTMQGLKPVNPGATKASVLRHLPPQ